MQYPLLEDALNDMAVIRTTFETLVLFPADDPIRAEMLEVVLDARNNLIRRFQDVRDGIQANRPAYHLDAEKIKAYVVAMMTHGYPGRVLNSMMKVMAFDEGEAQYYYRVPGIEHVEAVRQMPAPQVVMLVFDDMLQNIQDNASYSDGRTFRQTVFQKYIALLFICFATTDPKFYGMNE
jgi:hypothetical protein